MRVLGSTTDLLCLLGQFTLVSTCTSSVLEGNSLGQDPAVLPCSSTDSSKPSSSCGCTNSTALQGTVMLFREL